MKQTSVTKDRFLPTLLPRADVPVVANPVAPIPVTTKAAASTPVAPKNYGDLFATPSQVVIDITKDDSSRPPGWSRPWRKKKARHAPANMKERSLLKRNQQDERQEKGTEGPEPNPAPVKKRRDGQVDDDDDEVSPPSDKWIVCTNCTIKPDGHNIYPGFAGEGQVPAYDKLALGENKAVCNLCTGKCKRCNMFKDNGELVECDSPQCRGHVCMKCLKRNKLPLGPFWCSPECRSLNEKPTITGKVLPFCTQTVLHAQSGDKPKQQYWAVCTTCAMTVCIACASVCHSGHNVLPAIASKRGTCHGWEKCRCGELKCCTPLGVLREDGDVGRKLAMLLDEEAALEREKADVHAWLTRTVAEEKRLVAERKTIQDARLQLPKLLEKNKLDLEKVGQELVLARKAIASAIGGAEEMRLREVCDNWATEEKAILDERAKLHGEDGRLSLKVADIEKLIRAEQQARVLHKDHQSRVVGAIAAVGERMTHLCNAIKKKPLPPAKVPAAAADLRAAGTFPKLGTASPKTPAAVVAKAPVKQSGTGPQAK